MCFFDKLNVRFSYSVCITSAIVRFFEGVTAVWIRELAPGHSWITVGNSESIVDIAEVHVVIVDGQALRSWLSGNVTLFVFSIAIFDLEPNIINIFSIKGRSLSPSHILGWILKYIVTWSRGCLIFTDIQSHCKVHDSLGAALVCYLEINLAIGMEHVKRWECLDSCERWCDKCKFHICLY